MAALIFDNDLSTITNVLTFDPGANPLTVSNTQGIQTPTGTTAQRPGSPTAGLLRNNSDLVIPETFSSGAWQPPFSAGGRGCNAFFDDFLIDNAAVTTPFGLGWTPSTTGTGAAINGISSILSSANNNLGVVQLSSGTTTTGVAGAKQAIQALAFGYGIFYAEFRVSIPVLSTGTQTYVFYIGFIDDISTTADQVDGIYFEYRQASDTHWRFATSNASTRTKTNSTATVTAGNWDKLGILVNASASTVTYFVNDTSVGTITTNIPTANQSGFGFKIAKSVGTTARSAYVDYAQLSYSLTTVR